MKNIEETPVIQAVGQVCPTWQRICNVSSGNIAKGTCKINEPINRESSESLQGLTTKFEPNLDAFRDLYFRGKFADLLDAVEAMDENRLGLSSYFRIQLFRISALFEMHRIAEAHTLIRHLNHVCEADVEGPEFLHCMARLKYLDGDFDGAMYLWSDLAEDKARRFQFKGKLGLANVLFSQKRYDEMPALMTELQAYSHSLNLDEDLSLKILHGNYYWSIGKGLDKAKQIFHDVMAESMVAGWYYFVCRAMYGLACVAQAQDNLTTLKVQLEMLNAILRDSDNLLLKHLVNKRFHQSGHICTIDLEVDYESKRVRIRDKWIDLHKTPSLLTFIATLYGSNTFVTKQSIAAKIWPEETYKPRIHNPRIFNIARRVREAIEAYDSQPVVLLSGRYGYKLAVRET